MAWGLLFSFSSQFIFTFLFLLVLGFSIFISFCYLADFALVESQLQVLPILWSVVDKDTAENVIMMMMIIIITISEIQIK